MSGVERMVPQQPPQRRRTTRDTGLTWPLAMLICGVFGLVLGTYTGHEVGLVQGHARAVAEANGECSK